MAEHKQLQLTERKKGDKVYHNVDLLSLDNGDTVVFKKKFAEGRVLDLHGPHGEYQRLSVGIEYEGQICSGLLPITAQKDYNNTGGVDDTILMKVTREISDKNPDRTFKKYTFEVVDE